MEKQTNSLISHEWTADIRPFPHTDVRCRAILYSESTPIQSLDFVGKVDYLGRLHNMETLDFNFVEAANLTHVEIITLEPFLIFPTGSVLGKSEF
jgi:hypothetical protein